MFKDLNRYICSLSIIKYYYNKNTKDRKSIIQLADIEDGSPALSEPLELHILEALQELWTESASDDLPDLTFMGIIESHGSWFILT